MKGLFIYTYNPSEEERLICVSDREDKLIDRYNSTLLLENEPLVMQYEKTRHLSMSRASKPHYMILDLEVL